MTGQQLTRIREGLGMSKADLADVLNSALDRKYRPERVGEWEKAEKGPPAHVAEFVASLAADSVDLPGLDSLSGVGVPPDSDAPPPAPGGDAPPPSGQPPLGATGGTYAKICEELWGTIALMLSSFGAVTGKGAYIQDGRIIDADKEALGIAWGKFAETNATFRNMLMSTVSGGAVMQVIVVTGTTTMKIVSSHNQYNQQQRMIEAQQREEDDKRSALHVA